MAACLLMVSCIPKPQIGSGEKTEPPADSFEPATLDGLSDGTKVYEEYKEKSESVFSQLVTTDAEDFELEDADGGVAVKSYKGESDIVAIPEKIGEKPVVQISAGAFADSGVRSIYIPDSVKKIELGALADADSLQLLRVPFVGDGGENTHFAYIFGAQTYESGALSIPVSLETVVVGEGEDAVAERGFFGLKSLDAVIIEGVVSIGKFAFYECDSLAYVGLSDKTESIGAYAFGMCGELSKMVIPDSVKSMGLGTFYLCRKLCDLTLPIMGDGGENTHIGYIFGAEKSEWNEDFVPMSLVRVTLTESVTRIEGKAFESCEGIAEVVFPGSLEYIGVRAFVNCRSLARVELGENVRTVGGDAFFGCDNLVSLKINGKTEIGPQAFYGCGKLTDENKYISPDATVAEGAFGK